jgi:hypothetical protein
MMTTKKAQSGKAAPASTLPWNWAAARDISSS